MIYEFRNYHLNILIKIWHIVWLMQVNPYPNVTNENH